MLVIGSRSRWECGVSWFTMLALRFRLGSARERGLRPGEGSHVWFCFSMRKIANGEQQTTPATIDDPAILDEIGDALQEIGDARATT